MRNRRVWAMTLLVGLFGGLGLQPATPTGALNSQIKSTALRMGELVPPGCTSGSATVENMPRRVIPSGPAVITDTITVSGVNAVLWDLNLSTVITHTNSSDLDITLRSPAGTLVTVSTDNGGVGDDAFGGTTWDDSANPGGQLPYTFNNGMVTDNLYVNQVVSLLTPEEPFAAFAGENPNGVWLLTISDDQANGAGNLINWGLNLTTLTSAPADVTSVQGSNPTSIPISNLGTPIISSTLSLTPTGFITRITATTALSHTFPSDLDVTLMSPAGIIVTLTTDNGSSFDHVFNGTVWDVDANPGGQVPYTSNPGLVTDHPYANLVLASPLVPEESLGAFWGSNPAGTWVLTVRDDLTGFGGSLDGWSLNVTTGSCGGTPAVPPVYLPLILKP